MTIAGCGSQAPESVSGAADAGDAGGNADASLDRGFGPPPHYVDGGTSDATWRRDEGGFVEPDGAVLPADRFVTHVVSYKIGSCGGYSASPMPGVVEKPPSGEGPYMGSTDVFSLGNGGEIVVSFEPNEIVDRPGIDFIVFENPFYFAGTHTVADAEEGEVSVSDDGVHWTAFPCTATTPTEPDGGFGECAGVHPVLSNPTNGISPVDPRTAGGDPFDLAWIGVKQAKYVRIVDKIIEPCVDPSKPGTTGFDLDAISIVHGELP